MEGILSVIIDRLYQLYERFGRWFVVAVAVVLVLLLLLVVRFVNVWNNPGGVDRVAAQKELEKQQLAEAAATEEANRKIFEKGAKMAAERKAAEEAARAKRAEQAAAAAAGKPGQTLARIAVAVPLSNRPEKLADWKPNDYLSARREADPRLFDAIDQLAARSKDSDEAARLLVSLLQTLPPPGYAGAIGPGGRDSTTAIVDALVANGSSTARTNIRGLLTGSIPAPNEGGVVTAVFGALARRGEAAGEELLLATLVEPNSAPNAGELRQAAAAVFQANASENLRLRLAKRILEPNLPPADRARLIECLKAPRPENLAAQALLFTNAELEPQVVQQFQKYFLQASGGAVARLSGLPAEPGPGSGASHLPDGDVARVARAIWTAPFCEALDERLAQARSLGESRELVMLAETIPLPAARSALERTLERLWYESPVALAGTAWPPGCQPEPGLLFVLKSLPHRNVAMPLPSKYHPTAGRSTRITKPVLRVEHRQQDQIALAWLQNNVLLVRAMMGRFRAAALARKIDDRRFAEEVADAPISLEREAKVVAAFAVDLPGAALAAANPTVEPLRIRYFMADETATFGAVSTLCKRQLKACELRNMSDCVWVDGFQADPQSTRQVSVDVVVRKLVPNAPIKADESQNLVIEVLSVETIPESSQAGDGQAATDLAERSGAASSSAAQDRPTNDLRK